MSTEGLEGCDPVGGIRLASKLTIVAPDSGQNLVTRTCPGGGSEGVATVRVVRRGRLVGRCASGKWRGVVEWRRMVCEVT